jgi:glycosyltransferase involved in cell wall biosynthesis
MSAQKPRVLFVLENERYGGGERAFSQLICGLDKSRFDVYAACLTGTPGSDVFAGEIARHAKVLRLDLRWLLNLFAVSRLRRLIAENSIGIVHSQGPRADFYCRLALAGTEIKHVCTVASPVEEYDVGPLKRAVYIAADRFLASSVDKFVAVAGHIAGKLRDKGVPPEKVAVIYNGVDAAAYYCHPAEAAAARAAYKIPAGAFLVSAFCRLVPEKGLHTFVNAACDAAGSGIKFLLAGEGPLREELEERVETLGIGADFIFAGFVKDVRPLLQASDLVALPSLREGFPMAPLEAMAAGKPVVASDIEGTKESVADGVSGLLVPPGDGAALAAAIKRLAGDRALAAALGAAGREAAGSRFSLRRMTELHEALYGELLK